MSSKSSKPELQCHWCPDKFETNRDLKNHAASEKHSMLRVICPWCTDEEKSYRRITELQKHADKRHPSLTIEAGKEFFSESNGFYLSFQPEGYQKLIKPKEFESIAAMTARAEVSRWLYRVKKPSKTKDQWEEGWQLARGKRPELTPKPSVEKPAPYSPCHPAMTDFDLELANLNFTSSGNVAYMRTNSAGNMVWFKVDLGISVFDDKKAADNLLRRMRSCPSIPGMPTEFNKELQIDRELASQMARALGISEKHIKKIHRQAISFDNSIKAKKRKLEVELEVEDDIELGEVSSNITKEELKRSDNYLPHQSTLPTAVNTPYQSTLPTSINPASSPFNTPSCIIYEVTPFIEPLPEQTVIPPIVHHNIMESSQLQEEQEEPKKTIRQRAEDLLYSGVMPILPPARRDWDGVSPIELAGPPCPITWPPMDWQDLSAEERLTAWMSTAMALEFKRGVSLTINRSQLLDRYAMLALPGTTVEKGEHNHATTVRLLNYNMLKNIYLGNVKENEAESWISVLEAARNGADRTAEHFGMNKLKDVSLRIVESTDSSR